MSEIVRKMFVEVMRRSSEFYGSEAVVAVDCVGHCQEKVSFELVVVVLDALAAAEVEISGFLLPVLMKVAHAPVVFGQSLPIGLGMMMAFAFVVEVERVRSLMCYEVKLPFSPVAFDVGVDEG